MRKLIDIPANIVPDFKKMAVDQNKDLKNFIQDHLITLHKSYIKTRTRVFK